MAYVSRRFASQLGSGQRVFNVFKEWYVSACGYRQLGLRKDDLMNEEDNPDMAEALRRLNEDEQNLRLYRIKRALDLSMKHQLLPKEDWTKPTEALGRYENRDTIIYYPFFPVIYYIGYHSVGMDVEYLTPFLESVIEERKERERWNWK